MNILYWIIFGAALGLLANILDPHPASGGFLGTTGVAIIGAISGGVLGNIAFGIDLIEFNILSSLLAMIFSISLLFIQRVIFAARTEGKSS